MKYPLELPVLCFIATKSLLLLCSNPTVQIAAVEAGALQQLIRLLSIETCVTFRSRLLAALSSLIRHFPFAQRKFVELGGLQTLSQLLTHQSYGSQKLSLKAVTLVSDLLTEQVRFATAVRRFSRKRLCIDNEVRFVQNLPNDLYSTCWHFATDSDIAVTLSR